MGYPLSVRGQVRRAQGPLPCVAATVLCSWRLPSLGRVPMSPVPRRRRYYEGATTSHPASRTVLVRDRYGLASTFEIAVKAEAAGCPLGEVPMVSIDRLFGGASSFRPNPWIREYMRWFLWGVQHLRRNEQQSSMVRIPHFRGSGVPASPAAPV